MNIFKKLKGYFDRRKEAKLAKRDIEDIVVLLSKIDIIFKRTNLTRQERKTLWREFSKSGQNREKIIRNIYDRIKRGEHEV